MKALTLYFDDRHEEIGYGMEKLKAVLRKREFSVFCRRIQEFSPAESGCYLAASVAEKDILTHAMLPGSDNPDLPEGAFIIKRRDKGLHLTGGGPAGTMYGLLDLAEKLETCKWEDLTEDDQTPHMALRGLKFNLPWEPYDNGDAFSKNRETCLKKEYWESFLNMMADNRYNLLSLWSEHPFHMMVKPEKFPETCPFTDEEIHERKELFKFIFRRAKERGIRCALITWNIRINKTVARGLGLPEELGDMEDQYWYLHDKFNYLPNNIKDTYNMRQNQEIVKDYFKECIKTLLFTYRDLWALGTNCAEEMKGDPAERHEWVKEVYGKAVAESGRDIPFIMRTNMGNGKVAADHFFNDYTGTGRFLSWKYSNAHMYSHPRPQFEDLWDAWKDMEFDDTKILYTVRNDDFHTFRGAAHTSFLKEYFLKMKKDNVAGYYWGADGYLWADDFQHIPHHHKSWTYDFERQWYQFALIGRLSYNPDLPDSCWEMMYKRLYGRAGALYFKAFQHAGEILPPVNRLLWINFDYEWHPESLLSVYGLKTVLDFLRNHSMPGIGTLNIRESVENEQTGLKTKEETASDIVRALTGSRDNLASAIEEIEKDLPPALLSAEPGCVLNDLKCWRELASYYICKISAAMALARYELTDTPGDKDKAVNLLKKALPHWDELSALWSRHYLPYMMVRTKHWFGYPYYREDVIRDIDLAASYKTSDWGNERKWEGGNTTVI